MRGLIAAFCVVAALALALHAAGGEGFRGVLWKVVRACVANHTLTGASFPCLEVNVSDGDARGYVILRPQVGPPALVLSPTRKIVGVEDPLLQASDAPNYFEQAWNAQSYLPGPRRRPLAQDEVGLAVNSRPSRTQDQLHIHIGCLTRDARRTVHAVTPDLSADEWRRIARPIHGLRFWGRLVAADTLAGVSPFRLAAAAGLDQTADNSQLMIVVAGTELADGREGFVLLASRDDPSYVFPKYTAEDFLVPFCA